jgi:uncharacterized lipoprotein YddW (UPF0748 family)
MPGRRLRDTASRTLLPAIMAVMSVGGAAHAQDRARGPAPPEIRAVWVDAFHDGIRSPDEVARLIATATRAHLNTVIVQVRRRGDALYTGGLEPPLDDPNYAPSFDALGEVVAKAHAAGLQVHAWINAMPVWRDEAPPKDPRHVFNQHGPAAQGEACWLTAARDGARKFPVGYFLDPGHPAARDHLVAVYLDIVRRYDVDGIHFDYIRYPETDGPALPRGANVGYNPVSVTRFQKATGRADVPEPGDEDWIRWRREQVTQLVRRISIEARAIKPRIKVSAALIPWGSPPAGSADFANVAPMQRIFQDWQGWLAEGLLDLAVPMNYARERDDRVRGWFNGWIAFEKHAKDARQLAVGVGAYLNAPDQTLAQIRRVRTPDGKTSANGFSIYSYFQPAMAPTPAVATGATLAATSAPAPPRPAPAGASAPDPGRLDFLVKGFGTEPPALTAPAPVPAMPWIETPTRGRIAGSVIDASGQVVDGQAMRIRRTGWFRRTARTTTDANGWFGMMSLKPGTYDVRLEDHAGKTTGERTRIRVTVGAVARAALTIK